MKYYLIGDEDTVLGFSLVGVEGKVVNTREDVEDILPRVMERSDIGIILINERFAKLVQPLIQNFTYSRGFPLIIEIPDRNGPDSNRHSVDEIVRNSIGIKI